MSVHALVDILQTKIDNIHDHYLNLKTYHDKNCVLNDTHSFKTKSHALFQYLLC